MKAKLFLIIILFYINICHSSTLRKESTYWSVEGIHNDIGESPDCSTRISGTTIIYNCFGINCYGHALLDGIVPLFKILKDNDLLSKKINLIIPLFDYEIESESTQKIIQFIKDIFPYLSIIPIEKKLDSSQENKLFFIENLLIQDDFQAFKTPTFSYYEAFPESFKYIEILRSYGFQDNLIYKDKMAGNNLITEFSDYVKGIYCINKKLKKSKVLICRRNFCRKIINESEIISKLVQKGYDVEIIEFEKISIKEQISKIAECEYLIGTYGSNLSNAIFLNPSAKVVVLWHVYSKYFWSRRYCIIHSAFLSNGVTLVEYDKPTYDPRDIYTYPKIQVTNYFIRIDDKIYLLPEKINFESFINYPLPAMYEILNVDLNIDPEELINLLFLSNCYEEKNEN